MEDKIGDIVERRNPANQLRFVVFLIIFRVSKTSQGFTKLVIHSIRAFFCWRIYEKIGDILALPYPYLSLFTTFYSAFPVSQGPSEGFHN